MSTLFKPRARYFRMNLNFFGLRTPRRLDIGLYKDGSARISMGRDAPKTRMDLSLFPSGSPALRLFGGHPEAELRLGFLRDSSPEITLGGPSGTAVSISGQGHTDQFASIAISPKGGRDGIRMSYSKELTHASICDGEGHVRTLLGLQPGQEPHFFLYDRGIHALLEMTEEADGRARIKIDDPEAGESRVLE
jgi:hypothetical protein